MIEGAPKGDCAQVAVTLACSIDVAGVIDTGDIPDAKVTDIRICHGWPVARAGAGEAAGCRYFHAWVEVHIEGIGPRVLDWSNGLPHVAMKRTSYYRLGTIDPDKVDRYTIMEARALMHEWATWGPWITGPWLWEVADAAG